MGKGRKRKRKGQEVKVKENRRKGRKTIGIFLQSPHSTDPVYGLFLLKSNAIGS